MLSNTVLLFSHHLALLNWYDSHLEFCSTVRIPLWIFFFLCVLRNVPHSKVTSNSFRPYMAPPLFLPLLLLSHVH